MNKQERLEIQAWLDGELPPARTAQIGNLVRANPEAQALGTELNMVRGSLKIGETKAQLNDTREFYWAQIELQIEAEEPILPNSVRQLTPSPFGNLMRWAVPAGSLVAIFALILTFGTMSNTNQEDASSLDTLLPAGNTSPATQPSTTGHTETTGAMENEKTGLEVLKFSIGSQNLIDNEDPNSLPESIENPER